MKSVMINGECLVLRTKIIIAIRQALLIHGISTRHLEMKFVLVETLLAAFDPSFFINYWKKTIYKSACSFVSCLHGKYVTRYNTLPVPCPQIYPACHLFTNPWYRKSWKAYRYRSIHLGFVSIEVYKLALVSHIWRRIGIVGYSLVL